MIEAGKVLCDSCNNQIVFEQRYDRVLIEFVKGGADRHYCNKCFQLHKTGEPQPKLASVTRNAQPEESLLRRWWN